MDETGEFVSTESAAQLLGVSAQRVRTLLRDGTVAGRRQGRGWLVQAEDLERYRRDREASGRRRSDRAPARAAEQSRVEAVSVEGLSPAQLRAQLQELQTRVEELSRRNAELEEQLRRVRLLAELLRTETPVPATRG
ncbi:helix-turn-helix domain-containing protein [Acidipropionibacterium acidipropionici]|uniref:helix-turn-helix domain-containing protein n=1 Tax=Acidipropionibacterium acidipropionici TaxID=1748 RepID=UPI00059F0601|nr:helix-turn-helix domain-containing protein [Acidipropionibacterium acidipropionici]